MEQMVIVPQGTAILAEKKGSIVYVERYDINAGWLKERYPFDEVLFVDVKRKD